MGQFPKQGMSGFGRDRLSPNLGLADIVCPRSLEYTRMLGLWGVSDCLRTVLQVSQEEHLRLMQLRRLWGDAGWSQSMTQPCPVEAD